MLKKSLSLVLLLFFWFVGFDTFAQFKPNKYKENLKSYNLPRHKMYKKDWIDLNKNGKMDIYENPDADIDDRIEDLISQMNLEEKTNQMVTLYGYGRVLKDDLPHEGWSNELWKDGIGAIDEHLNGFRQWGLPPSDNPYVWPASKHAWAINEVQRFFIEETRLGIPVDFTNEGIRGVESFKATNFPTQLGIGTSWNRELVRKIGEITGKEARLLGYTNVYAPILDVGRDQRWGRYEEIYGESPFLVAELGVEMTKGVQKDFQVASTAKHYVAYSNNKGGREGMSRVDPQMSWRELQYVHLYPWKRVIRDAGLLGVMSSYNDYDGFPVQGSYYWLTEVLRKQLGFKGYVVSDSDAVEYLYMKHNTAKDMKEAVYQAVMAGLNVRCTFRSPESYVLPLRELVQEGRIPMAVIDEMVRDVLRVKFMVGIFDNPYQMDFVEADAVVNSDENQKVALQASREAVVLLKNENHLLPLDKEKVKTISVCGPNADDGQYAVTHYGPLAVEVKTVYQGLVDRMGAENVLYTKGCEIIDANWPDSELFDFPLTNIEQEEIDKAVENAKKSDVAIVVLGENSRTAGENKSRTSLNLTGRQQDLLKAVYETGTPTVLILINGRPQSINWAAKYVPSILEAWYPGSQGGTAISEILFGDYNPSGKLTVTFPKTEGQIPFNFPNKPASQVDGGYGVGPKGNQSRAHGALYYFGHGLSYTTFEYKNIQLSAKSILPGESIKVSFDVTNTGKMAGTEIVQLYTRDVLSSVTTYEKNLRGFEPVFLEPGETKNVEFTIIPEHLELLNLENEWVVEPGEFKVMVGASSVNIKLEDSFFVGDGSGQNTSESSADLNVISDPISDSAANVLNADASKVWNGRKGNSITVSLKDLRRIETLFVDFGMRSAAGSEFTVQVSSGGGQFINLYSGKAYESKRLKLQLERSGVSDIRIIVDSGSLSISNIRIE